MSQRETRLLLIAHLRLQTDSVVWDIGAGTGTIPIEIGLLCPQGQIAAIERDQEVANLIRHNCDRFGVENVQVIEGSAPKCLQQLAPAPDRVCIEGGRSLQPILQEVWQHLQPAGRIVATATNLETLYTISQTLGQFQARHVEVVQSVINRLETRGNHQIFAPVDPIFIVSGEKLP